jgi:glutathione S-transferase
MVTRTMSTSTIVLHHHPFSRAANAVWMLEEIGQPYELKYIDFAANEQRTPEFRRINPMGKLPTLDDGGTIVTESAAIGLYLADRYAYGTLAPRADDPARGTYLRWSLFAPSVIEPGTMARTANWEYRSVQAGWGEYDAMLDTIERAIGTGPWLLGDRFSMADVIFGGTVRYMLMVKLLDPRPAFVAYGERLAARPACQAANAKNEAVVKARGLKFPGSA